VEQKTDYERLIFDIQTDGSIHPKDALKEAAKILIYHFMLFSDEKITLDSEEKRNDEEFDEPGYEDAWLRECLMHGAHCTNVFLSEPIGHHQHHERPPAIYGRKGAGSDRMRLLWHQKMKDAVEGRIPWKAKLSILYDHAKEHTQ